MLTSSKQIRMSLMAIYFHCSWTWRSFLPSYLHLLTFTAIRSHSPAKPVLIFVSSRRQTRLTALDLIAYLATEDNPKQWLHQDEREVRSTSTEQMIYFHLRHHSSCIHALFKCSNTKGTWIRSSVASIPDIIKGECIHALSSGRRNGTDRQVFIWV